MILHVQECNCDYTITSGFYILNPCCLSDGERCCNRSTGYLIIEVTQEFYDKYYHEGSYDRGDFFEWVSSHKEFEQAFEALMNFSNPHVRIDELCDDKFYLAFSRID